MDLYSFFYETVIDPIVDRNTRALKSMEFRSTMGSITVS